MDYKALVDRINEDQVQFISLQFTDVTGAVKSLDIPISQIERAVKEGVWFDGSSVEGFARIQESDMRLIPDLDTYAILPWSPIDSRRARMFCDIYLPDGSLFLGDPRGTLKRILERIEAKALEVDVANRPNNLLQPLVDVLMIGEDDGNYSRIQHLPTRIDQAGRLAHSWQARDKQVRIPLYCDLPSNVRARQEVVSQ